MFQKLLYLLPILFCNIAVAQVPDWMPPLKPGERLVAINGVPVNQIAATKTASAGISNLGQAARYVVNRNQAAYNHALREAQILARNGSAGHPLGCAPGTRRSGTGYSYGSTPNHCYYGQLPDSQLVARACVRGRNGALYWSAHYR